MRLLIIHDDIYRLTEEQYRRFVAYAAEHNDWNVGDFGEHIGFGENVSDTSSQEFATELLTLGDAPEPDTSKEDQSLWDRITEVAASMKDIPAWKKGSSSNKRLAPPNRAGVLEAPSPQSVKLFHHLGWCFFEDLGRRAPFIGEYYVDEGPHFEVHLATDNMQSIQQVIKPIRRAPSGEEA